MAVVADTQAALLDRVADYYNHRLATHGATPHGVDWNGAESQALRFRQLGHLIDDAQDFSIADIGCGYGALLDYLDAGGVRCDYIGTDVSENMIAAARERHGHHLHARFVEGPRPDVPVDYAVASGIFNVRGAVRDDVWHDYLRATLDAMHADSRRGYAFNCLSSRSDRDRMRPDLYYADPAATLAYCLDHSRHVALLHDYGLYEFTILVRKEPA
ncbi:MAG: class I SAM-dependent methyltransferase [Luteimonas sp.]